MEAFGTALWGCSPQTQGALMDPLQSLTSDMSLATILGMSATAQLEVILGRDSAPVASIPIVLEMLAPQGGAKCWCHSSNLNQEEEETVKPDHTTEEHPHQNGMRGGQQQKLLKSPTMKPFPRSQQ